MLMSSEIDNWYRKVAGGDVVFLFKGEITTPLIVQALDVVEQQLEHTATTIKKKIYNVLIECMQNVFHHSATTPIIDGENFCGKVGVCLLLRSVNAFHVITGNYVAPSQQTKLTEHLNKINSLDRDGLKELYKDILDKEGFSEKGGGGLGFVDIARKSNSKINYQFLNGSNNYNFFTLDIALN